MKIKKTCNWDLKKILFGGWGGGQMGSLSKHEVCWVIECTSRPTPPKKKKKKKKKKKDQSHSSSRSNFPELEV